MSNNEVFSTYGSTNQLGSNFVVRGYFKDSFNNYYNAIKTPEDNFIAALHGNNKDNRHYNDNIEMYKAINYMKSLDKYL